MESTHIKDETLISEIFNKSAEAWNTNNIELFSSIYTPEIDYITFMGEHIIGLEANVEVHRKLWNSYFMRGSTLEGRIISIKFPYENSATMIAEGGIKLRFQKKIPAGRMSVNTTFLVKKNGEWKICSFQNTRIKSYGLFARLMMWIDKKLTK